MMLKGKKTTSVARKFLSRGRHSALLLGGHSSTPNGRSKLPEQGSGQNNKEIWCGFWLKCTFGASLGPLAMPMQKTQGKCQGQGQGLGRQGGRLSSVCRLFKTNVNPRRYAGQNDPSNGCMLQNFIHGLVK